MAFFQQLKLLLWKNWLTVIRQPIWSVTLVAWPVIIFVIIAVTRHQFPPVIKEACYVKPRNLPSTGVLPFLQTLMCNTDSTCEATSQLVEKSASTKARNSPFLPNLKNVPLNFTQNEDPAKLLAVLNNMLGTSEQGGFYVNVTNTTSVGDKETLKKNLGSMKVIKKVICTLLHPMMNRTLPKPLSYALHSFCKSNSTPFEASLGTLNMILAKLMETNPEEMAKLAGAALLVFDRLQNETSLWETLLAFPRVFSSGSIYEALASTDVLLTNIYKSVRVIKKHFPEAGESFSGVSSLIDLSLPLIRYAQSWPGKGVKISLGDVLIEDDGVNFDTLKNFQLSLDLAIVLVLDKQTAYDCLCSVYKKSTAFNSTDQLCAEGVLRHALERVSPSQLIKQIFTAWSQQVAAADISFAKSQLQSMMGYGGHDVSNMGRRARRSVGAQDQYIDLVLDVGHVVMEIVKGGPYEELFGSYILGFGFEYMKTAAQALDFVETFLGNALNDIGNLRQTYLMLMTNQSVAEMWISRVFDSAFEAILKSIVSENSTCGDILSSFEWLLNTSSTDIKLWNTLICQNRSALSIIQMNILQFFTEPLPTPEGNITLSIFVAELHKLYNKTLRFGAFLERVTAKLHAMNWISDRTHDIPETLQKSFFTSLVNFGEMLEKTQLWPMLENYFHMAFWILNYRAGVTTQPPNCTLISVENILCNTGFKWPQFVHEMVQALMSPNQDVLSNCLKGSVTLLQHLYGDLYRLRVQLGDDIQSAYLTNLVLTLDSFIHNISKFTDQQITNSNIMAPLVGRLFHVTGLSPLLPFIFSNHPLNFSTLLDVASTIGRLNQQVLTFNVTDPSMAELELLTRQLCSLENLTLSVSHIVGHTLLTYSLYFKSDEVGRLKKGLQPFKNQTSAPYVEAIINAMEQLETVIDSSNGNPTQIILAYIQQLQGFVKSLSGLRKIQHVILPNGELSVVQVTDLSMMSNNILDLLSPESLRMLTQVGPDVAQNIVIQRFVALLPPKVQQKVQKFLQDVEALQLQVAQCGAGDNCLAGVSEIFVIIDQILDVVLSVNGTIQIAVNNTFLEGRGHEEIASLFFSLLLSSDDSNSVETFRRTLNFIRYIISKPNITVSDVQNALRQSNLTIAELNNIAMLAGNSNITALLVNVIEIINARQCFEPRPDPSLCVLELIKGVSGFLMNVPALRNETAIISFVAQVFRNVIFNAFQLNLPLNSTLANVTMSLQQSHLMTPEIKKELQVLVNLIKLVIGSLQVNNTFNTTMINPTEAQMVYLKLIDWYLRRVINITSNSTFSELLEPFFLVTQMQVSLQLAQTNFSLFVSNQIEFLMNNLQYPLDSAGLRKIGLSAVEISRQLSELIFFNLRSQNNIPGFMPILNATVLTAVEFQVKLYLNATEMWMKQLSIPSVLLQWGNASINISSILTDTQHLLGTIVPFLRDDELANLYIIGNVTESLRKALMTAEQQGGLQSDQFIVAIVEAVQVSTQALIESTAPTQLPLQQDIMDIVHYSLKLILQPTMNFASSRNITIIILQRAERVIQMIAPKMVAKYLLPVFKVATSYFETISRANGQDWLNQLIFYQLNTIQNLLPPNTTAQTYFSIAARITQFILDQGNMTIWGSFGNETLDKLSLISSQLILGHADQGTWEKLRELLRPLLSSFRGTELWDGIQSAVTLFEKIIKIMGKIKQEENAFIQNLQVPVVTLMREIAWSVNSSHFNVSDITKRMQLGVKNTVHAVRQANGTLNCTDVLIIWEPVRQAAGLNASAMSMWCSIHVQPLLEAYRESIRGYSHLNISQTHGGPMTVNATVARVVNIVQTVYQITISSVLVTQQLVMNFSNEVNVLTGWPLSPEAQLHFSNMIWHIMLQNSLTSFKLLTDNLHDLPPTLRAYINAVTKALEHILNNSDYMQDPNSSMDVFKEAIEIFLAHSFPSSSGFNEHFIPGIVRVVVQELIKMEIFGDAPMVYKALENFLASNSTSLFLERFDKLCAFLTYTNATGFNLLTQLLPRLYNTLKPPLSILVQMFADIPGFFEVFEDLTENIGGLLTQLSSTGVLLAPMETYGLNMHHYEKPHNKSVMGRYRRESLQFSPRETMDDFLDLSYLDYQAMSTALSYSPKTEEILETAHMFFANPDLNVVVRGVAHDLQWSLNAFHENTLDAALGVASFITLPHKTLISSVQLLADFVNNIPDEFPFSSELKNITSALASESEENLILIDHTIQTAFGLLHIKLTDDQFKENLELLTSQVCALEKLQSVHVTLKILQIEPGELCRTYLTSLEILTDTLNMSSISLTEAVFQAIFGNPNSYNVPSNWTSTLTKDMGLTIESLVSLKVNITSPGDIAVGEMLKNKTAFILDVQRHMDFDAATLHLLLGIKLPNRNLEILSWLLNLHRCNSSEFLDMNVQEVALLKSFCSLSQEQWYMFSVLVTRHLNIEKVIYRMVLSEEVQTLVQVVLQVAEITTTMIDNFIPVLNELQVFIDSIKEFELVNNIHDNARKKRSTDSGHASFVTLSQALCSNGMLALFGISEMDLTPESSPQFHDSQRRQEMIEKFKIPQDATPFCMNMYLDMVNTTGGAIAWAFLKPMLMGHILYTPDTPVTRDIMEKANATLQEFANLRKNSEEWIKSSKYTLDSVETLQQTLPVLQNSLGNAFVKNFIEMQTDIDVGKMRETLSNFSNMTVMLEENKHIMKQITTLSQMMVQLSSCVKFDRYRGYNSTDELNKAAQVFAANRDLYASVIFKLPKDKDLPSSKTSTYSSSLPPKVSYTIRMHMDNVMRTDKVRAKQFVRGSHISAGVTLRYNRGFIYLQESIDRAIIETQTGHRVSEPAVQLQPFPYPCHILDEYLLGISIVFPLVLMMAWMLFVADFVKKLVHERELRLHEYMKMMGVNPLSHFFAWFLECVAFLVVTILLLTLVLKYGSILPKSDSFLVFLYLCDYGLSIVAFSYLIASFFDKTYIAGLSGSLIYILCFFPFIMVMAIETSLTFSQKNALSLFSPTCFSYASQYVSRYENLGEGIQWSNSYSSPISGDTASFGWLCWLLFIDSILYFLMGAYIRMVFPGKYGIPAPWFFPFKVSFWANLCCCSKSSTKMYKGLLFNNIMQSNHPVFMDSEGKGQSKFSSQTAEDLSELRVGVSLHSLGKIYGDRVAIQNLNVSFYEGHITSLLGHNGAGKTTTMSLLTGLFSPSFGSIEIYGRDMQSNIGDIRRDLGVCMQYDVLFDHMTTMEHLLLYGQLKAPQWSHTELREHVRTILLETGMYPHRHKQVGTLSGGMKRKLSISIAFIGGSRLVVLDEPTTGVDPCSRRNIWDIIIQHKKNCTIIMSTHHLDEAEVLSDRIALLEKGSLKCCGSPFYLKDKLCQGYKLTLTKKTQIAESDQIDTAELKSFIQAHVPEARLKETQGGDLVYSLPPFSSSSASSYRSLLTALDSNLDALQLGGYGISDTTLEEVFLQLIQDNSEAEGDDVLPTVSKKVFDTESIDSFQSDLSESTSEFDDKQKFNSLSTTSGLALAWQQTTAILIKRFHHSRRDWKGLISEILLPVVFVFFAMGLGSLKTDVWHYPELELSPALYNMSPSYSFFSNQNPNSSELEDIMLSFPGLDNSCLDKSDDMGCTTNTNKWNSSGNSFKPFTTCKCTPKEQTCAEDNFQPPHKRIPSSQIVYNLSGINVENYLAATANDFIRNRYGGFSFGMPLPKDLQTDISAVPADRTLAKVWFNPEGHHTMPAYLNSLNNFILRTNLPADKDPHDYGISVFSHPYYGHLEEDDVITQGVLHILVSLCVLTGYSITTASFAMYEVSEHHSGSKMLQHIAGVSEPLYWVVNFFYDMVMYLIPVFLTVAVIAVFKIPAFTDRQNLGAITLLLVLFGFATFPWMYLLSGVFKDPEMAFISYMCINLFISVNTILSTSILFFTSQIAIHPEFIKKVFLELSRAFLIFPQFNFGNGLMTLARQSIEVQILKGYNIDVYQNPFSLDVLGWMLIISFVQGLFFFTLRLLLNKSLLRKVRNLICGKKTVQHVSLEDVDEDVASEHIRVSSGAASSDILQVKQLTKVYQHLKRKTCVVKMLSVGIPAGECFGLLGENGAGKTTTFKMLTGDVSPTGGTAQIRDRNGQLVDIMECRSKGINIGYCPQEDALDNLLTGEEHLYFYGRIRGISKRELDWVVRYLLMRLELNSHKNIITDGYSCGTRRKLSTALALIGHPQILLLDEPSSGMDPHTKRHLWKIISEEVKGKCAVVLTSHSMEECEALCGRLAIMVKGQFRCLGSLQHIKNRFGIGFTVKMYLTDTSGNTETITGFMQCRFPSTYLKDQHSAMLEYHVPVAPGGVADIFNQLESNKNALHIKHFSVSQTTLDEVFINFVRDNFDMDNKSMQSEEEPDGWGSIKEAEAMS